MTKLSIRARLTVWYTAMLAVAMVAFGIATWMAMRHSLVEAVDVDLRDRLGALRVFMDQAKSMDDIRDEFDENSALGPGGDLFQVRDPSGAWLHRSAALAEGEVDLATDLKADTLGDALVQGRHLRTLARNVVARGVRYTVQTAIPVDEAYQALNTFRWILFALSPPMLALAAAGGAWISGRALRPITELVQAAESIDASNLGQRLAVEPTGDELQRLAETLNGMLDRLDDSFTRVARFTGDASHELRTPIALIRAASEVSLRKVRSVEEYQDTLREIGAESERLTTLISDLLALARADAGLGLAELKHVDLGLVVRDAAGHMKGLADTHQIQFRLELASAPALVLGDRVALQRVVAILLDNAIKYTVTAADVVLRVSQKEQSGIIEVCDQGVGIGAPDLPLIFERFYRADKVRSRDSGGAGLGLSIARWIVDTHRGRIEVSSTPGEGSTFRVILPSVG